MAQLVTSLPQQKVDVCHRDLSWEETYDGAWAVAAPVRDDEGHALGAFGVATPISPHSRAVEKDSRDAVIDVAARAASALRLGQRTEHA